jgi:PAS domain S-box-containing protein
MRIAPKRKPRLPAVAAQFLLGVAGLALITVVCFDIGFGVTRTSFVYLILITVLSLLGSFSGSVLLSILAVGSLNYFFVSPLFEFRVDDPDDVVRLAVFFTTSLIVTALTAKLRRSEARFRTFVDHATDAFFLLDDKSTVLDVNRQACDGLGYSREDLIGKHRSDFDVGLDDASIASLKQRIVAERVVTFETRHRRKDGTSFPVEVRVSQFEQVGHRFLCVARDITERKRAEDELRAAEDRFRSFVDHATDGFFLLDEQQAVLDVNRQACEALGYEREEMIGMRPSVFDAGLDAASIARIGERVNTGETVTFETLHRRKDGTAFPVEVRARRFQHGSHQFRLSVVRDITERKRAEEVLRESEAKLQRAQGIAHFGWWERDFTTHRVSLSDEVCRIFGLEPVELPEWHARWLNLIHPEDQPKTAEAAAAALVPGGARYDVEYRVIRPDGSERTVHSQGDVTRDELGQPLRQFGVLQDITELRGAEKELRASEARFRTFVDQATDAFFLLDDQLIVLDVNSQACVSLGYSREELIGMHPRDFDSGLDEESIQRLRERITDEETVTFETRHRRKDGTSFPVEIRAGQFEQGGRRLLCLVRDITERNRAEDALRRSESYLAEAQRLSHTGTIVFNATGPVYWSEESYRIWGLDPLQGLPHLETVLQRIHPDDRDRVNKEAFEALHQKSSYAFEFRIALADGTVKYLESTGHPLLSAGGQPEMVATHVDVTERKRAQEEHERLRQLEADLAHVNRISIMGELAASLAHEILHPIATARNNARAGMRFLELSPPNLGEVKEALACVVRDADRAKDIVGRMRDHIKKAPPRREPFDLNEAIHEVIVTVRSAIDKNGVSVQTRLMRGLNPILGDRVQVQQVVLNLILNATEAMSSVDEGARNLSISIKQGPTSDIVVAVQDSGPGIDPEHLERVFAPFYTTKTSGIGMGLSICQSIVAAHGGRLWAEVNRPRGAIFQFTLPAGQEDS